MWAVRRGYDGPGYVADPDLAQFVIEQLAKAGLQVGARGEEVAQEVKFNKVTVVTENGSLSTELM